MRQILLLAGACFTMLGTPALADNYPEREVRIIVGYPPGGASDIVARLLAKELGEMNNQPFIVENKPGVGGMLSLSTIAQSPADGYNLGLGVSGTLVTGPHLQEQKLYDPKNDFSAITMVAKVPMVLLAGPGFKGETVQDLITNSKKDTEENFFASGAQAFELAYLLFNSHAGIDTKSVLYKGGAAAAIDVMAGRVPTMIDSIGAQNTNIKSGKLRALAVLDSSRSPIFPDVPTMKEAGLKDYEAVGWISLMGPKGMPEDVLNKLNGQIKEILANPEIKNKLTSLGFEPAASSPQELQKAIEVEYDKWEKVVRDSGIKPS